MSVGQARALPTRQLGPHVFAPTSDTVLWWLTNAGFLINARGTLVMVDPAISMSEASPEQHESGHRLLVPLPLEAHQVPRLDAVLYTHSDYDHMALRTAAALLERTSAQFIGPPPVVSELDRAGFPKPRLQVSETRTSFSIGHVAVTPTPADHPWQLKDPERFGPAFAPGDCLGYLLHTPDGTVWHTGDTRLMPEHLELEGAEVLLLDVSRNEYHLGLAGAVALANALPARHIIPYHYGSYDEPDHPAYNGDPAGLRKQITEAERRFRVIAPGEPFLLDMGRPANGGWG